MKNTIAVFAIRLQQYAADLGRIQAALDRLAGHGIDDDDYSPSSHTPSRNTCRDRLDDITGIIRGYCLAVDDVRGTHHGHTQARFYAAYDQQAHRVAPYESIDHDSGHQSMGSLDAVAAAVDRFQQALFGA